jgi:hypothetical protein
MRRGGASSTVGRVQLPDPENAMSLRRILPAALVVAAAALPVGAAHAKFMDNPGPDAVHIRAAAPHLLPAAESMRMRVRRDRQAPDAPALPSSCDPSL